MKLYVWVAIGLVAGMLLGLIASITGSELLTAVAVGIEPIGTAFVNLLKMVVIPLIVVIIFVGVGTLGDLRQLGQLGALTLLFFAATSAVGAGATDTSAGRTDRTRTGCRRTRVGARGADRRG